MAKAMFENASGKKSEAPRHCGSAGPVITRFTACSARRSLVLRFNSRDTLTFPGLRTLVDQAVRVRAAPLGSTASWSARRNNSKYRFSAFDLGFAGVYLTGLVAAGMLG